MDIKKTEFDRYSIQPLTKDLAKQYIHSIAALVDLIPQVSYTKSKILAESKDERVFYGKWEHSLALFDEKKLIAVIMAYERKSEGNKQYPLNTVYISELAVDTNYQRKGIAKGLIRSFLDINNTIGFRHLIGKINFSVQTNSADWNKYVEDLYKSFGFTKRATKDYENRTDIILELEP